MKKSILFSLIMVLAFSVTAVMAGPRGQGADRGGKVSRFKDLNLTEEQSEKIKALRDSLKKDISPLRTEMVKRQTEMKLLWMEDNPVAEKIKTKQKEINDFFDDKKLFSGFTLRLDFPEDMRPFTRKVLEATARIPLGETKSYKEVAASVGKPNAARAVGNVMAGNPLPLVVPCHRVLASGGGIGGFGGGLPMKRKLLAHEARKKKLRR